MTTTATRPHDELERVRSKLNSLISRRLLVGLNRTEEATYARLTSREAELLRAV